MSNIHQELFERSLHVCPGGVHSPVRSFKNMGVGPLFFKSAKGAAIEDMEGRWYVDFCQSFGPLILGHRDPEVEAAVIEQIHTAWSFGAPEPYSLLLAEWITKRIPWAEKVRFVSSGTEAVMSALRVARAATGRDKVLKFDGCYHGHFDTLLVKSGSGLAGEASTSSAGISPVMAEQTLVCPLNDEVQLEKIFEVHGKEIACVVIEPVPANYGLLLQRKEFLEKVAELTKAHGALLLFDEVISGFRVALGGMAELTGIRPDLVTYGKILGGGFPVGCYGGRHDLMDLVAPLGPVYQAGTLSANPVGMVAGLATLEKCEKLNAWKILREKMDKFAAILNPGLADTKFALTSFESLFWIHGKSEAPIRAISNIPADHGAAFAPFFRSALSKGVYLAPNGYEVGFLSLAHSDEKIQQSAEALVEAAHEAGAP